MNKNSKTTMRMRRCLALFLCVALAFSSMLLISCSKKDAVMSYESVQIDEQTYCFWFSYYKMQAMSSYGISGKNDTEEFWRSEISDGVSYGEYFTRQIDERIKAKVIATYLYDVLEVGLPDYATEEIDEYLEAMLDYVADGNIDEFNEIAEKYNTSYEAVKKAAECDYKAELLFTVMYGDGSYVSDEKKSEYYKENYHRVKVVFVNTKTRPDPDNPSAVLSLTQEEKGEKLTLAARVEEKLSDGVDYSEFEDLMAIYSDDTASSYYKNGFYLCAATDYPVPELVDVAASLDAGEYAKLESDYGIHFVLKYPLDEKAYENDDNADWFEDFSYDVSMAQFEEIILESIGEVKVNNSLKSKWNIENIKYNYEINPIITD